MKTLIYTVVLMFYALTLFAQQENIKDTVIVVSNKPYASRFVTSCDTNSSVVILSFKMSIPEFKLPLPTINGDDLFYHLKSKYINITFSLKKNQNKVYFWLDKMEKHCFTIDPSCKYSLQRYKLSDKVLEVYGKLKWNKFYKNFRVIFYFNKQQVLFDFDDQIDSLCFPKLGDDR